LEKIEPTRGGFRKPISTRKFVLDYLRSNGEAYVAEMHRAYKDKLRSIAEVNAEVPPYYGQGRRPTTPRPKKYVYPRYHSFQAEVWRLAQEGLIELTRSEPTDGLKGQFKGFETPPERHYYRIPPEEA
jgi:hypothetical protein